MSEADVLTHEPALTATRLYTYDTSPQQYWHWKLSFEGAVATLTLDVNEDAPLNPGYKLKLNSYDLGVDIELHDALQRLRFEHPEVGSVIVTSARERIFCSGANIFMLGLSSHAWKVNFCKFTNETRNGMEDASRHSGLKFIAACNGTTAGGGYELALACDEIYLIDDRSSAVSLPEVPLLGVLPGTGGLTRLTDKRRVRRDHADIFCTLAEGVRAARAKEWRLIDGHAKPQRFVATVKQRAEELAALSDRPREAKGIALTPLARHVDEHGYRYEFVEVEIDRENRRAAITVSAPRSTPPTRLSEIEAAGASWWPLQVARELDDAILLLRTNELCLGTWILQTRGDATAVLASDASLIEHRDHWFVRETIGMLRRTLSRLEVTSRSMYAMIDRDSCFAGTLLELALAADRTYMLDADAVDEPATAPCIVLSELNFGAYPMVNGRARIEARFHDDEEAIGRVRSRIHERLDARAALDCGLVTVTPDALDWDDEIRMALEERTSLSPDALTAMEANLRFGSGETLETRVFGRLSAWQNWVFVRTNAVGSSGALKVFGTGKKARFDWERV
ncbi:MAG: 2,3-epoxybenzoyl-CoA dihydrolase [Pseudomonadota bacterium]|nr:2,3-epoxybenzoyl-CoA dihydrolase [Pseudomonadota bacterium]